ncbi:thiolase [Roseivivax sp. THAF30]|uniref:thiolase n=1 Tax=Roseivivax sp. THAF30 TaxID=2587852 RepID=UPI001268F409|nr:thiolase [Roseivivax sp. THAF30]QFT62613.1 thiolase [Roseivivax sp. THAF30]
MSGQAKDLRGKAAIVGMATAGIGEAHGFSAMELLGQAAIAAVRDAGLELPDVDGVFAATSSHAFPTMSVVEYLGLRPRFFDGTNVGGSSFEMHLLQATMALDAGLCDVALVCYGSNQRTAGGKLVSMSEPQWHETPYRPRHPITAYGLAASRHMAEYGTTREDLAEVALAARGWANLNPEAFARGPLTKEEVLGARMISDPLTKSDCCLVTDGAAAVVLTRADRAKAHHEAPVYVMGVGAANYHRSIVEMPDLTTTAAVDSGNRAFEMAGARREDMDVVMLYDAFTINTLLFLEDLGFCPKGEGGRFVQDGRIAPGGELAVNTNGGGLSCVHPGMYGLFLIAEAVTQLRGAGGERQIADATMAVCHGNGGTLSSQCTAILGTEAAL